MRRYGVILMVAVALGGCAGMNTQDVIDQALGVTALDEQIQGVERQAVIIGERAGNELEPAVSPELRGVILDEINNMATEIIEASAEYSQETLRTIGRANEVPEDSTERLIASLNAALGLSIVSGPVPLNEHQQGLLAAWLEGLQRTLLIYERAEARRGGATR